jgi:aspartate/methionine/tyrosine aminotransferase
MMVDEKLFEDVLREMDVADIAHATIRQLGAIAGTLERRSGTPFLHLEIGVPGLPPEQVGIEAEIAALHSGVASIYPDIAGTTDFKNEASRFVKAFLDVDIAPRGCFPTVGSMQGAACLFQICGQRDTVRDTILFIDPGFPVQRLQAKIFGIRQASFDIYDHRAERLAPKLESYLARGNITAIVYSNPNNPAWICLTDGELQTIGELATKYDAIVIEDLAYLGMDFRKQLGHPFRTPYAPTVARYTDNYVLMISASKIFSYAGQRVALAAISDKLYERNFTALKERYGIGRFGDSFAQTFLYAASSGTSHSAQHAMTAMLRAASDGKLDFVEHTREYARRAALVKEIFVRHGFHIVYDRDLDEAVGDGFFFTAGYDSMTGTEMVERLMRHGICAISLSSAGSTQHGVRVCVSAMNRPEQFVMLDERLREFGLKN